jgi:hypothetical protein
MNEPDETYDDPPAGYTDEHESCPHGVSPKWDCDWCGEES